MVNSDQIKQRMKAVCNISVSITKRELGFGATRVMPKLLRIVTVAGLLLITLVGQATKQFSFTAMWRPASLKDDSSQFVLKGSSQ